MPEIGFESVIGQRLAVEHLQNALHTEKLSQAYLIHGEKGSGKMALATALAAALVCENPQNPDNEKAPARGTPAADESGHRGPMTEGSYCRNACGKCHACLQMKAASHPDVIVVTNERVGATTKTGTLGVPVSRFIQSDVAIKPYEGDHKIYIIPHADRMNQQAQNAILKTLEEPPAYAMFLLLTDNLAAFLPTILSRCVTIELHPAPEADLVKALTQSGVQEEEAVIAARLSHGNPGRSFALASEELISFRKELTTLLEELPKTDSHQILEFAQNAAEGKEDQPSRTEDVLDLGRSWYRDILVMKSTGRAENLIFRDQLQYIRNVALTFSYEALQQSLAAFDEAEKRRKSKENETQIMELLLLKLRAIESR